MHFWDPPERPARPLHLRTAADESRAGPAGRRSPRSYNILCHLVTLVLICGSNSLPAPASLASRVTAWRVPAAHAGACHVGSMDNHSSEASQYHGQAHWNCCAACPGRLCQVACAAPQQLLDMRLRVAAHRLGAPAPTLGHILQGSRGERRPARHAEGGLGTRPSGRSAAQRREDFEPPGPMNLPQKLATCKGLH